MKPINACFAVNGKEDYERECAVFKQEVGTEFENKFEILVDTQNQWDNDDKNNVSNHRINLKERINYMRKKIDGKECF
jgi:hypothetical protein